MNELNKPVLAGNLLDALYWSIRDGKKIFNIPSLIEQLLAEDIWKRVYIEETERTVSYEQFEDILTTPPPEGLGTKVDILKSLVVEGDKNTLEIIEDAINGKPGRALERGTGGKDIDSSMQKMPKRPSGARRASDLKRLRIDRPDLLQRVLDKEITINQAMIEAGFRKKRIVVYAEVEPVVKKLKEEFERKELNRIIKMLQDNG